MKTPLTGRWSARFAVVALLALALLAPGCGRPPDTAWLRFLGFSTTSATSSAVLEGNLQDGKALTANANFENRSLIVGKTVGTGILIYSARIDYRMSGYSPPAAEYPLNLYLPPSETTTTTGTTTGTGTLAGFPIAPASLKSWLIAAGAGPPVELTAQVTFFAETDEGAKLETRGGIGIALNK